MSNKELKPCPFCGEDPTTAINYYRCGGGELELKFSVICPNCKTSKGIYREVEGKDFGTYIEAMNLAIAAWNRRASDKR